MSAFLMGQHKADLSSEIPQGHQSPRGQVASANWPGGSYAAGCGLSGCGGGWRKPCVLPLPRWDPPFSMCLSSMKPTFQGF